MVKIIRSVRFGAKGLRHAFRSDRSFRMEVMYGLPVYVITGALLWPFASWELLMFILSYMLILIVELVNTAFETMLARVHPEDHELIGRSKDIGAAAVLVAFCFAIVVVVVLALVRLVG
jgi:diacylglycerol kinase (ATP)